MKYFTMVGLMTLSLSMIFSIRVSSFEKNKQEKLVEILSKWEKLNTVHFSGKQDDIFFTSSQVGWYGNGKGYIYKTIDGGTNWNPVLHLEGTFFRALGFIDENIGFAGNIGPDYFTGVTDKTPLYQTEDGGENWFAVKEISPVDLKGICSIDILKAKFINSGELEERVTIRAAGRVGGPAKMSTSRDGGKTWSSENLSSLAGMILDVKFVNETTGFLCAASDSDIVKSHARILKTEDGGTSWKIVYESRGKMELIWKCSFPEEKIGYATLQSYDQNPANSQRYVLKTVDGGESWEELPLVDDYDVREFGVGFINKKIGWVGAINGGYLTYDGGLHWTHQANLGIAVNKIRVIDEEHKIIVFSIGKDVRKLVIDKSELEKIMQ